VDSINISCKIPNDKALVHLEFKSKVLPGSLYYLSAWLGFRTSSPQQGINCQPRYWWGGVGSIDISCKIPKCKVLAYNWHMCLDGIEHLNPTGRCQISSVILGEGSINISCKFLTAKFLPTWLAFKRNGFSVWVGLSTLSPHQGVKFQLRYWVGIYKYFLYSSQRQSACPLEV
jgi:hypothetical protein